MPILELADLQNRPSDWPKEGLGVITSELLHRAEFPHEQLKNWVDNVRRTRSVMYMYKDLIDTDQALQQRILRIIVINYFRIPWQDEKLLDPDLGSFETEMQRIYTDLLEVDEHERFLELSQNPNFMHYAKADFAELPTESEYSLQQANYRQHLMLGMSYFKRGRRTLSDEQYQSIKQGGGIGIVMTQGMFYAVPMLTDLCEMMLEDGFTNTAIAEVLNNRVGISTVVGIKEESAHRSDRLTRREGFVSQNLIEALINMDSDQSRLLLLDEMIHHGETMELVLSEILHKLAIQLDDPTKADEIMTHITLFVGLGKWTHSTLGGTHVWTEIATRRTVTISKNNRES